MEIVITIIIIYLLPTFIAFFKKKKNLASIAVVNVFLGWSIIGWIVALAWSVAKDTDHQTVIYNHPHGDNSADKLEKLSNLKEKGVITEEEFNKQKEKILKD